MRALSARTRCAFNACLARFSVVPCALSVRTPGAFRAFPARFPRVRRALSARFPCVPARFPRIPARSPCVPARSPCVPTRFPCVPERFPRVPALSALELWRTPLCSYQLNLNTPNCFQRNRWHAPQATFFHPLLANAFDSIFAPQKCSF